MDEKATMDDKSAIYFDFIYFDDVFVIETRNGLYFSDELFDLLFRLDARSTHELDCYVFVCF